MVLLYAYVVPWYPQREEHGLSCSREMRGLSVSVPPRYVRLYVCICTNENRVRVVSRDRGERSHAREPRGRTEHDA